MWVVYLLYSPSHQIHYVGSTDNLSRRLDQHNKGKSTFTSMTHNWTVVTFKEFGNEVDARNYERLVKKNKKYRKEFYAYKPSRHALPV